VMSQVRVGDRAELADELAEGGLCDLHRSLTKLTMRRGSEERFVPPLIDRPCQRGVRPGLLGYRPGTRYHRAR
jgi:hypothetical protein